MNELNKINLPMWIPQIFILFLIVSFSISTEDIEVPNIHGPTDDEIKVPLSEEDKELEAARDAVLQKFFEEWLIYMKDFDPSEMLNVEIPAGDKRRFFDISNEAPQMLRGAYAVSAKLKNKIRLIIYDPDGVPIIVKDKERESIFYVQVNKTGEYSFEFENHNV